MLPGGTNETWQTHYFRFEISELLSGIVSFFEQLSFEVHSGDCLAIIGPNGAGKTALLKALQHLIPYEGEIHWSQEARLGYVPQSVAADRQLPLKVRELLAAKARVLHLADQEMDQVSSELNLSPEFLSAGIGTLSGGQFQKVLIAFALLGRPNVLLFDEPTASLDELTEERIYELVHQLHSQKGITVILVSHDLSIVYRYASRVLCLSKGKVCMGPPKEIMTPEMLEELYGAPPKYYRPHPGTLNEACAVRSRKEEGSSSMDASHSYAVLLAGLFAIAAGLVGSVALMKRMVLASDVISHLALPGLGIAFLLKSNPLVGGGATLFLGTLLVWQLQKKTGLATDASIGVVFAACLGIGALVTPQEDLLEALFGNFQKLSLVGFLLGVAAVILVVAFLVDMKDRLILDLFSPELAAATGVNVARLDLGFLLVFSLTVLVGLRFMGALLSSALIIIPAATARQLTGRMAQFVVLASAASLVSVAVGFLVSTLIFKTSTVGPTIVIVSVLLFVMSLLKKK